MTGETDLAILLRTMAPRLNRGAYVYTRSQDSSIFEKQAVVTVREAEGLTIVLPQERADALGLPYDFVAAWITLEVHSSLHAVGLTAEVSRAFAQAGLSANIVAGFAHDHVFVPYERATEAMDILRSLTTESNAAP